MFDWSVLKWAVPEFHVLGDGSFSEGLLAFCTTEVRWCGLNGCLTWKSVTPWTEALFRRKEISGMWRKPIEEPFKW